jgi:anaerobic ribonucleoside-triphosphate reductase
MASNAALVETYIDQNDWKVKENSNQLWSVQGMHNYITSKISEDYWLKVYSCNDKRIVEAHKNGDIHIHDIGMISTYCCGWDTGSILSKGLRGVPGITESKPPMHFGSALGQLANFLFTLSGECFSDDTMIFVKNTGWKYFSDVTMNDEFLTLSKWTRKPMYQRAIRIINAKFEGELVHFSDNKTIDLKVTENHRLFVLNKNTCLPFRKYEFILAKDFDHLKHSFVHKLNCEIIETTDDLMIRRVQYDDRIYCVEVPNSIIYVRRHGKAMWCGNCAGALALNNFDTYLAPYIRLDNIGYDDVKQHIQEFVFNMNIPTRTGFQCLSSDTEIHTATGWRNHTQIKVGDLITTFNIESEKFQLLHVTNFFSELYEGKMCHIRTNTTDQLITPNHRIVRRNAANNKYILEPFNETQLNITSIQVPVVSNNCITLHTIDLSASFKKVDYKGIVWCPTTSNGTVIARRNGTVFITGNSPFTNLTFDLKPPQHMTTIHPLIGGKHSISETYGDFQAEMIMINRAFLEVMTEGDRKGRIFSFPIPTYNITDDFEWDNPLYSYLWKNTAKYGTPYFANYVNSDLNPQDARSMCCRLRLDLTKIRSNGGYFGANSLTGSCGVVTINIPRISVECGKNKQKFMQILSERMDIARASLDVKRKTIEDLTDHGFYPYTKYYLKLVKRKTGSYWGNHFSTIGLIGVNEACINMFDDDIGSENGIKFAQEILEFMRSKAIQYQQETKVLFNIEATPAESTGFRFVSLDRVQHPEIRIAKHSDKTITDMPDFIYTNSTQLPVEYTDDVITALEIQNQIQPLYTGGTVFHTFIGESEINPESVKQYIKMACTNYKVPYITLTPTFSVCSKHGYIKGRVDVCPKCGKGCDVYSRIVGYYRRVHNWNQGKQREFNERKTYSV